MGSSMNTDFGAMVQRMRRAAGKTLDDVASELHVSKAFLSAIENGKKRVPDDFVSKLEQALPEIRDSEIEMEALASQNRKQVVLPLISASVEDALLANSIAKKFDSLSDAQKNKMREILKG